jgi:transposase
MVTLMDPNDPQEERVFLALRRLQLPHLRDTLAAVLSEAAKEQWTYLEFLDQILRREVDAKQGKRIRMGLQIAHFPCVRTIEGFDFSLVFCKVVAAGVSAVYLRVAGANNSIVRDARVFLASPWSRRRLTMGPYSMDLRERVAAAIDEGEGSERQIAKRFRVSVSFVTRLLQRRRDAGTLAPKPHGGGPRPVLGFPEQVRLAMLIAEHPDATLNQLKEWGGFACTLTTLWRTLRRFRLTYKKKTLHAGERDTPEVQAKRRRYRAKVRRIEAKRLVFVDETGVNTAMTPTHAWARRGERAEGSVPSAWGSTTVIAALGLDGVRAPLIFPGATDTQAFQTYVDQVLVPELRPGDVVVFDNLKPHLSRHVAESIERAGATVLPLPPYSSDYDPIEELWSKFKGQLRRIAARTKDGLYKAVGETLDSVTIQDILGWFNHSGLYATHG